MSRGFFGGKMGGGGTGSGRGKNEFREKFEKMMQQYSTKRQSTRGELVRDKSRQVKDFKETLEEMMDERMFNPKKLNQFTLAGTAQAEEKELTKGQKAAMEHAMQKRAKMRMKEREQKVDVIPKSYTNKYGGWIDKKGKIRNGKGDIVMEVNLKTGVITNKMGLKVGKYNPHSMSNDFKISRLIDKYSSKRTNPFNPFAVDINNKK